MFQGKSEQTEQLHRESIVSARIVSLPESAKEKEYAERMDAQGGVSVAVNTIAESFVQDTIIPLVLYFPNRRMSVTSVGGEENARRIEPTT